MYDLYLKIFTLKMCFSIKMDLDNVKSACWIHFISYMFTLTKRTGVRFNVIQFELWNICINWIWSMWSQHVGFTLFRTCLHLQNIQDYNLMLHNLNFVFNGFTLFCTCWHLQNVQQYLHFLVNPKWYRPSGNFTLELVLANQNKINFYFYGICSLPIGPIRFLISFY